MLSELRGVAWMGEHRAHQYLLLTNQNWPQSWLSQSKTGWTCPGLFPAQMSPFLPTPLRMLALPHSPPQLAPFCSTALAMCVQVLRCVPVDTTLWPHRLLCQSPLSMGFPRQASWSGLPFPSPEDLPNPGTEPMPPALGGEFFNHCATREAHSLHHPLICPSVRSSILSTISLSQENLGLRIIHRFHYQLLTQQVCVYTNFIFYKSPLKMNIPVFVDEAVSEVSFPLMRTNLLASNATLVRTSATSLWNRELRLAHRKLLSGAPLSLWPWAIPTPKIRVLESKGSDSVGVSSLCPCVFSVAIS